MRTIHGLTLLLAVVVGAPPVAADGVLDRIKADGEIRMGFREDAAPLSFRNEAGDPAGYSVLICDAVAEGLAKQVGTETIETTWLPVTATDGFQAVADGKIDLLCGAATVTLTRRELVDFSLPTFVDGAAVLLKQGADPSFDALAGKKVGVHAGTTTEEALRNSLAAKGMTAEVVTVESHPAGLEALLAGEIDAYFGDQSILYGLLFASDPAAGLAISENTMTVEKHALALPRGDSDFRLAVDRALSELFVSGRMVEIFREAFPGASPGAGLGALYLLGPDMP